MRFLTPLPSKRRTQRLRRALYSGCSFAPQECLHHIPGMVGSMKEVADLDSVLEIQMAHVFQPLGPVHQEDDFLGLAHAAPDGLLSQQRAKLLPQRPHVGDYMNELIEFINREDSPKYDLLKVAIAHHRFVWIHPFGNGNGRTVRLFTYAMMIRLGFNVSKGRILNPTAVFCSNRNTYYQKLSKADTGTDMGILSWCEYVLEGLKDEIEKIDKLLDYDFLKLEILLPTIAHSLERKYITDIEAKILKRAIEKPLIQASDIKDLFAGQDNAIISRQIKKLIEKKMLTPEKEGARKYMISFNNNFLLRGIINSLGEKGFLPIKD